MDKMAERIFAKWKNDNKMENNKQQELIEQLQNENKRLRQENEILEDEKKVIESKLRKRNQVVGKQFALL